MDHSFMDEETVDADGYGGMDHDTYAAIVEYKKTGHLPDLDTRKNKNAAVHFRKKAAVFVLAENDILVYVGPHADQSRVVVRKGEARLAVRVVHEQYGHPGQKFTIIALTRRLYWRSTRRDVIKYLSECMFCVKSRSLRINNFPAYLTSSEYKPEPPLNESQLETIDRLCLADTVPSTSEQNPESLEEGEEIREDVLEDSEEYDGTVEEEYLIDEEGNMVMLHRHHDPEGGKSPVYMMDESTHLLSHDDPPTVVVQNIDHNGCTVETTDGHGHVVLYDEEVHETERDQRNESDFKQSLPLGVAITHHVPIAPSRQQTTTTGIVANNGIVATSTLPTRKRKGGPYAENKELVIQRAASPEPVRRTSRRVRKPTTQMRNGKREDEEREQTTERQRRKEDRHAEEREPLPSTSSQPTFFVNQYPNDGDLTSSPVDEECEGEEGGIGGTSACMQCPCSTTGMVPSVDPGVVSLQKSVLELQREVLLMQREYMRHKLAAIANPHPHYSTHHVHYASVDEAVCNNVVGTVEVGTER